MATVNNGDPTLLIIIVLLIVGFIGYAYLNNYRLKNKRKELIRAFRTTPVIKKDNPILVQGPASAPDHTLPTTGEHVAFYGIFVLSRELAITEAKGILNTGGVGKITGTKGFRFFETSGDFLITPAGTQYLVSITSAFAYFEKGASMVSSVAGGLAKSVGMPGSQFDDAMGFEIAEAALRSTCGYESPIKMQTSKTGNTQQRTTHTTASVVSVKSHIDSRIQYYNAGINLPQGIQDLLAKRNIVPEEKEEIMVVETFIPLNREVQVFGTYDGEQKIVFHDSTVTLSVSYNDPAED
jgi:hypothetical protein